MYVRDKSRFMDTNDGQNKALVKNLKKNVIQKLQDACASFVLLSGTNDVQYISELADISGKVMLHQGYARVVRLYSR